MKKIKIANKEYIFVEVPDNTITTKTYFLFPKPYILQFKDSDIVLFDKNELNTTIYEGEKLGNCEIITTTNSITEEIAKTIVESFNGFGKNGEYKYRLYNERPDVLVKTALESFYSLMDSLELDRSKNYLLIEKL